MHFSGKKNKFLNHTKSTLTKDNYLAVFENKYFIANSFAFGILVFDLTSLLPLCIPSSNKLKF